MSRWLGSSECGGEKLPRYFPNTLLTINNLESIILIKHLLYRSGNIGNIKKPRYNTESCRLNNHNQSTNFDHPFSLTETFDRIHSPHLLLAYVYQWK